MTLSQMVALFTVSMSWIVQIDSGIFLFVPNLRVRIGEASELHLMRFDEYNENDIIHHFIIFSLPNVRLRRYVNRWMDRGVTFWLLNWYPKI